MKALFLGSASAAALGLLLGGMARPELAIKNPQPMEPARIAYASAPYEPPPYVAFAPSYVLGADWARRNRVPVAPSYVEPEPAAEDLAYAERAYLEPRPDEQYAPEPSFPSIEGDILAGTGPGDPPVIETASPEA